MCEQAQPEEQQANYEQQDSYLEDHPACIARQKEKEDTQKENAETNAHESPKLMLKGVVRDDLAAGLAGRSVKVLPAEALITGRATGARHGTTRYLATAFGHGLAPSQALLFSQYQ